MAPPRQLPTLIDDLLEEIFLRISCPAALIHASATSIAFHRLITDGTFLRRYRTRHRLLLGFLDLEVSKGFHPVEAPHPGAPAARAIANSSVVDYLPQDKIKHWYIREVREGRVLIETKRNLISKMLMSYERKLVVLVFDSGSGSWTFSTAASWDDLRLSNGIELCPFLHRPCYAYGSFYWKVDEMNKLLKLDITRRELTTVDLPPKHREVQFVVVVEAAKGRLGMFSCTADNKFLNYYCYNNMQNEDRRANKWQMKNAIPLPVLDNLRIFGSQQGYIFLQGNTKIQDPEGTTCYSLDINTLKLERVIQISSRHFLGHPYFSFRLPRIL
ncbi:hypothetical protein EJB05_11923, partial [Eragrostis curvula]